jgi:hypothetical protein
MGDGPMTKNILLSNSLTVLADQVRTVLGESDAAEKTAIEKALEAGHLLHEAKASCHHGEWLPFLERSAVPERKAQRYMKLAKSGLKSDTVSDLGGIKAALKWAEGLCLPRPNELLLVSLNGFTSYSDPFGSVCKAADGNGYEIDIIGPEVAWIDQLNRPIILSEYVLPALFGLLDNRHREMSFRTVEVDLEFPPFHEWLCGVLGEEKAKEFEAKIAAAEAELAVSP